jgi:transposase
MESCGDSQHWARRLIEMGHQVKLMPAKFVKAFNIRNKNDAADAWAIWMATQMDCKAVAVKTEAQQAVLALHRMRQQLVKFRTMQINSLRGLLTEYGEVMGVGRVALDRAVAGILEGLSGRLPAILIDTLREQWKGLDDVDRQICQIERRLREWMKMIKRCLLQQLQWQQWNRPKPSNPVASLQPGSDLCRDRPVLAAQSSYRGKRGDTYLRTLLVHGARSIIYRVKEPGPWVEQMKQRRPLNVVIVAMANKLARIIWAMLAHQRPYRPDYASAKPA